MNLNLRRITKDKKITLKKLQELSGVPMYVIHQYSNRDIKRLDINHLKQVCQILGCTASDILGF